MAKASWLAGWRRPRPPAKSSPVHLDSRALALLARSFPPAHFRWPHKFSLERTSRPLIELSLSLCGLLSLLPPLPPTTTTDGRLRPTEPINPPLYKLNQRDNLIIIGPPERERPPASGAATKGAARSREGAPAGVGRFGRPTLAACETNERRDKTRQDNAHTTATATAKSFGLETTLN